MADPPRLEKGKERLYPQVEPLENHVTTCNILGIHKGKPIATMVGVSSTNLLEGTPNTLRKYHPIMVSGVQITNLEGWEGQCLGEIQAQSAEYHSN